MIQFKYAELAVWLKDQILSGQLQDGDQIPTELELASRFHLSRDTVRKAIELLECQDLLYRVKGHGTYVHIPEGTVFNRSAKSKKIGILMNTVNDYIFPDILNGINRELEKNGYSSEIQFTHNCISQERSALEVFLNGDFAGLILEPTRAALPQTNYDLYQQIAKCKPAVLIHAKLQTLPISYVNMGDEAAGFKLTKLLLEKGHRNIATVFSVDEQPGQERYLGYTKAYQKAGIPIPDDSIFWYDSRDVVNVFLDPLEARLYHALHHCTAVLCEDDRQACHLKRYLSTHSEFRQDIVICGFDDSDIAREYNFTSVVHPKEKLGACAASRLLEKIQNPFRDVSYEFDPDVVVRGW